MKKKKDWMTKSIKRNKKKKDNGIVDFLMVSKHFFKSLNEWIENIEDPRNISYITYSQTDFILIGIMKNVCSQFSMRQMDENFNEECCINTLSCISGDGNLKEMPHYDTINYYLEKLPPEDLSELRKKMVKSLIRGKQFSRYRMMGKYWRVILDGTGLHCFKEKHCDNCLKSITVLDKGKKTVRYYHKVLEAKLVLSPDIVISIGTEFIENESEDVTKQDCEINAAKRLMERIKKEYPRLKICIQGDALYAVEPIMKMCRLNHWNYIFTHKDTRQKIAGESFEWIKLGDKDFRTKIVCREKGQAYYANHVETVAGKEETMNMFEYIYETVAENEAKETTVFKWITDIELTDRNIEEMVETARGRWHIENEGFNNQKNGLYRIEHLNSRNCNAMKNHYLLTQIADILMQLYIAWNPLVKEINQSIKNTSSRLLESFRRHQITDEDVLYITRYTTVYLE